MSIQQSFKAALCASAVILASCAPQSDTNTADAPDLIVINGDIYTVDLANPKIEAFAVDNGLFTAVGSTSEIRALADGDTVVIDAGDQTVIPGLIDGHSHVSGNAPVVAGVDLSYVADKSEWLELIKAADARLPEGEWITGGYWDHTLSDGLYPTKEMLDGVVSDRSVFLTHIDGHYAWVNSHALKAAGVTADTPVPPGGEIVIDPNTGEPSGVLLEGAMRVVRDIIPARSDAQRHAGLAEMQKYANSLGLTGLHQMGDLKDYLHIVENGDPTLRVWFGDGWKGEADIAIEDVVQQTLNTQKDVNARVQATGKTKSVGPLLTVGYVKLVSSVDFFLWMDEVEQIGLDGKANISSTRKISKTG